MSGTAKFTPSLFRIQCVLQIYAVQMPLMKMTKHMLRKDIKKTIALMAPEQKKYQSDFVTEKVLGLVGKTQRQLFITLKKNVYFS
jgi:hypothetical protein